MRIAPHTTLSSLLRNGLLACAALSCLPAQAGVIDFEDVTSPDARFVSSGFDVSIHSIAGHVGLYGGSCAPRCPENGSQYALLHSAVRGEGQTWLSPWLDISRVGGGAFNLTGFDGTGGFNFNHVDGSVNDMPSWIKVSGVLAGGGVVSQVLRFDNTIEEAGSLKFASFTLEAQFGNLVSATFTAGGANSPLRNGFSIDNIGYAEVSAVPEPGQYALLLAGLALLGGAAARRRRAG